MFDSVWWYIWDVINMLERHGRPGCCMMCFGSHFENPSQTNDLETTKPRNFGSINVVVMTLLSFSKQMSTKLVIQWWGMIGAPITTRSILFWLIQDREFSPNRRWLPNDQQPGGEWESGVDILPTIGVDNSDKQYQWIRGYSQVLDPTAKLRKYSIPTYPNPEVYDHCPNFKITTNRPCAMETSIISINWPQISRNHWFLVGIWSIHWYVRIRLH